jgi:hypothetical protein
MLNLIIVRCGGFGTGWVLAPAGVALLSLGTGGGLSGASDGLTVVFWLGALNDWSA